MAVDDWRNEGIELASRALESVDVDCEAELLEKAVRCFGSCSDEPWLRRRAEWQLRAVMAKKRGDPAEQARCYVEGGMFREAARVCTEHHEFAATFNRIWRSLERRAVERWKAGWKGKEL